MVILLSSPPAQAQSNPTPTDCGLPAGGVIVTAVTYTMTADCVLTSPLVVEESIELNIVGGGFTITRGSNFTAYSGSDSFIVAVPSGGRTPSVALANVTLDAENKFGVSTQLISVGLNVHSLTTNFVSFLNAPSGAWGGPPNGGSWSLNNVLFRGSRATLQSVESLATDSGASALTLNSGSRTLLSGVVFERNILGGAALKVDSNANVVIAGCVSDIANIPRFLQGAFTGSDSLTPCTAETVGNGHRIETREATPQPCGYPTGGEVRGTTTFTLRSNCATTAPLYVTAGVTLTIDGEGHAITGDPAQIPIYIGAGSRVNLNDVALHGVRLINLGHIEGELVAFYPPLTNRAITSNGTVNINKLLMERLDFTNLLAFGSAVYTLASPSVAPSPGDVTIEDAIFKDITAGASAGVVLAWYSGATITFNGCVTEEDITPGAALAGGGSVFTDNRSGPCADDFIDEFPGKRRLTTPPTKDDDSRSVPSVSDAPSQAEAATIATPTPRPPTCLSLPSHISVYNITHSTQCQQVGAAGIGNAAVLGLGFRDGVDVWGWVLPNMQICFEGSGGSFRFLDAATSPRAVSELPAVGRDGMICTTINRAGTVALVDGPPAPAPSATPPVYQSLSGCMVTTAFILNFRDAPAGDVIGAVPYNVTLTALERTDSWFKVDYHGARGWISAAYVEPEGNCG